VTLGRVTALNTTERRTETVVLLDFGAQYGQLIARRVRERNVYCEIVPHSVSAAELGAMNPIGIILSGGPSSVYGEGAPSCDPEIFELGIPVLGICYGMHLMAQLLGGEVSSAVRREFGRTLMEVRDQTGLFEGFGDSTQVWMSHGDRVESLPAGFSVIGSTENAAAAAIANQDKKLYGVQFHPEVVHTELGTELIDNFLFNICGACGSWTMGSFVEQSVRAIAQEVGDGRVVAGLSGGIDSAVAAALVHRAIGDQLTCIYVDHGFMRKGETAQVVTTFGDTFDIQLVHVEAADRFQQRLSGVTDPETKRKIIGEEFIRVFEEEAAKLGPVDYLLQGTTYPDVIESGTDNASTIKSHHNVGGLPEDMRLQLLEPIRSLFKDEVREVARELGFPSELVWRQPFPGPGLAIRVIGEVTPGRLVALREADAIVRQEIQRAGLERELWQYFAVLLTMRSVGVMGDERTYAYTVVVRAVQSEDAMTADWARLPHELLERIANRITNEVPQVNRVVYDITSKPPGTIEWE